MIWKALLAIPLVCCPVSRADDTLVVKSGVVLLKFGVAELEAAGGEKKEFRKEFESAESPAIVLRPGETLRVRKDADCAVVFPEAGTVKVEPDTGVRLPAEGGESSLELLGGRLFLDIDGAKLAREKKRFRLKTPTAILAVKGTRFFAATGEGVVTAGVHDGQVELAEPGSGKSLLIDGGRAAMAKAGAISKPRGLTAEESASAEGYRDFAIEFSPAEKDHRKFETAYEAFTDPNTAIPSLHPKLISAEKSVEMETGAALKITILPLAEAPEVSIFAKTTVEMPVRLRSEPVGILFLARGTDVRRFHAMGGLKLRDRVFKVAGSGTSHFPEGTPPDEWVPFFLPLEEDLGTPETEPGSFTFSIDPNLHAGRAVESIVNVEEGKEKYILEITPLMVGVRPDK